MNDDQKKPLRDLFLRAVEIDDAEERARFLAAACAGDESLLRRVNELLEEEEVVGLPPASKRTAFFHRDAQPGAQIGPYHLIELLGEGGCGAVFKATQEAPVRRHVAIKVIKLGMDTEQTVARFEAERQALTMMDHPYIAQVHEAGATDSGRPYFVMELVDGVSITDFCAKHDLNIRDRLDLFLEVCQAVNHAHQKGVIHRDIKPSNILVSLIDGEPLPKIIDFGIAKAMDGRLTDQTIYTVFNQVVGTPAYMSPEQVTLNSAAIDTRSDVYSLGVLLYELLTSQPPFDSKTLLDAGFDHMRQVILEIEPTRPSTQVLLHQKECQQTAASSSSSRLRSISVDRDLDWITMKCLDKEAQRRYETVNALALDIQRHLRDEPVSARPPSLVYRFQKSIRRNRAASIAGSLALTPLLFAAGLSIWQYYQRGKTLERAVAAEKQESELRQSAEARAYASDMTLAWQALERSDLGQARSLIDRYRPPLGENDFRGWEWRYVWNRTRSDNLFDLCQRPTPIRTLTVSYDGRWLAVGGLRRGGLEIWDLPSRKIVARLAEDGTNVLAVFSPTRPLLAYTTTHHIARKGPSHLHLWDAESQEEASSQRTRFECYGLAFSQDGKRLITSDAWNGLGHAIHWRLGERDNLTKLREIRTSHLGLERWVNDFAATPDLRFVAFGADRGHVQVVDLETDEEQVVEGDPSVYHASSLAFSPSGRLLAYTFGLAESDIHLRDVITKADIGILEGHTAHVTEIQFTSDGKRLISSSADQTIRIWDLENQRCLKTLRGNRGKLTQIELMPDETRLISGSQDGTVAVWDLTGDHSRPEYVSFEDRVLSWRFTPDSRSLVTVNADGVAQRRWGTGFEQSETLFELESDRLMLSKWGISQDGALVAASYPGGITEIWNLTTRKREQRLVDPHGKKNSKVRVRPGGFFEDGKVFLGIPTGDDFMRFWELDEGTIMQTWTPDDTTIAAREGFLDRELIVAGWNGEITLRSTRDEVPRLVKHLDYLAGRDAALSPDKSLLAVSSSLGYVKVWETRTWTEVAMFKAFRGRAWALSFSPDGRRLAMLDTNGHLRLCDTQSWREVFALKAPGSDFWDVQFSPDGKAVGMRDEEGTLTIWQAPSWEEIEAQERPGP